MLWLMNLTTVTGVTLLQWNLVPRTWIQLFRWPRQCGLRTLNRCVIHRLRPSRVVVRWWVRTLLCPVSATSPLTTGCSLPVPGRAAPTRLRLTRSLVTPVNSVPWRLRAWPRW